MPDFIIDKTTESVIKIISAQEHKNFFDALLNPPTPSQQAKEAAKRYRQVFLDKA